MTASNLFWFALFAICALLWWRTKEIQQVARRLAKHHCDELGIQFLDDSVILQRIRLRRNSDGRLSLLRTFRFEFSTIGDRRYRGEILFLGFKFQSLELEPYRI